MIGEAVSEKSSAPWPQRIGLGFIFLWFFIGGLAHFVFARQEARIVPPSLSNHRLLVFVSGIFELIGAAGILIPRVRSLAGCGLMILTIAVTPANIYMWLHPGLFPQVPYWALTLRLPIQVLLLLLIWWATWPRRPV